MKILIAHGVSQLLKTFRSDSGALSGTCGWNWPSVALLVLVLAEAAASTALQ